jgi:hypothetical protein
MTNGIVSDQCSWLTWKPEETIQTISEAYRSAEQKRATSDLYFVSCRTQLIETVADKSRPLASKQFGKQEVTLVQLSFTNCEIWIALAGGGVTIEGGTNQT